MIDDRIPKVGRTVKFGDSNKSYVVKNVAEDVKMIDGEFKATGEGWVIVEDQNKYEYAIPFSRFIPKT